MDKLVTVIIPCYNAEKNIEATIQSVLEQTIGPEKLHILLINDGSSDGTQDKLEQLQTAHPEIVTVITQANQGVAKTRTKGISMTETAYLTFLDADDILEPYFLENLLSVAIEGDFDVVSSGIQRKKYSGEIVKEFKVKKPDTEWAKWILMSSCAKIHRTQFLKEQNIHFLDSLFGEDAYFVLSEIIKGAKFKVLDYIGYTWMLNPESMTNTRYNGISEYNSNQIMIMLESMIDLGADWADDDLFSYFILKQAVNRCLSPGKNATPEEFMRHYKRTIALLKGKYPKTLRNSLVFRGPEGEEKFVRYAIAMFVIIHRLKLMPLFSKIYCKGKENTN
ncbi:glycosyltransferase [Lactococcus garvieae subsp. garvieae]|uniref:glycosyltransferase family 2 protein n=1 Tax=Lactococcus garvieae TaxID=1363 RepID=UPI0005AAE2F2|nr:glycosyltransferase family 2 protein [Lactococcus garvieae]KAA8719126.1 glycosyltransferase [Lactococcus garvieae subsp. garvieae]MDG6190840.1 glycosyltransferase [Lactococcus garvieae]PCS03138.1 glycosyltransferase [Lactococcus garvieae]QPR49140.1 glycosyltransferase [Lactococcus garvieae]